MKIILSSVFTILASLIFGSQVVFAVDDITISLSPNGINMTQMPGNFTSESQTITISTTNPTGYKVNLSTTETTSALINVADSSITIPTITLPRGKTSIPAADITYGYGYSVDDGANYSPIPNPDSYKEIFGHNAAGENTHNLTFGVKTNTNTAEGTYSNTLVITAVANPPEHVYDLVYDGNGADAGDMSSATHSNVRVNNTVQLIPPDYSKTGYSFAGWSLVPEVDPNNPGTTPIYGPSEIISAPSFAEYGFVEDNVYKIKLYAIWIEPDTLLQNWTGCGNLSIGEVVSLTDFRDKNAYTVAKLADGNCWLTENLRLDPSAVKISGANTNSPTASFVTSVQSSVSTNNMCGNNDVSCLDSIQYNTNSTNRNLTPSYDTSDATSSWYSYGTYFNWFTATAGNGTYNKTSGNMPGDICPAGWRLPIGGNNSGEYVNLSLALGGLNKEMNNSTTPTGNEMIAKLLAYPYNYVYSGDYYQTKTTNRGINARVWSSTPSNSLNAYRLGIGESKVTPTRPFNKWEGFAVRCITKADNTELFGNIHYEPGSGTGTMPDETNVNLYTAAASPSTFTPPPGKTLKEWNTASDDSGIVVADGDMVAEAAKALGLTTGDTLTLYAIYGDASTLIYDANGGINPPEANTVVGSGGVFSFTISNVKPEREDYAFEGWSTDPNAAAPEYHAGDIFTTTNSSETIYAVWRKLDCGANKLCFWGNGADAGDTVNTRTISNTRGVKLTPSNFSRTGYGFAGWNTAADGTGTLYGPMESITTGNLSVEGEILYATWIASAGNMQNWSGCSSLNTGEMTALTDTRDNNTYTVAKLDDGNCWMTENLRLDPSVTTLNSTNTNNPTATFTTQASTSSSTTNMCGNDTSACVDQIAFYTNNLDRTLPAIWDTNSTNASWFSYGVLYNWYTASAGNGMFSTTGTSVSGDICPAGWRLPIGGPSGEFENFNNIITDGSRTNDNNLRMYPNNLIYAGDHNATDNGGRGEYGRLWSSTADTNANAFRFGYMTGDVTPIKSYNKWDAFSIRCISQ